MPALYYASSPVTETSPREAQQQEHQLGLKLLAVGLKDLFDIDIDPQEELTYIQKDAKGKPALISYPNTFFSISHCVGLVVCVLDTASVGVDAELPAAFSEALVKNVLTDKESGFLDAKSLTPQLRQEWFCRFWTVKEAYAKKSGEGLNLNFKSLSISFTPKDEVLCSDDRVSCIQYRFDTGHIVSVCMDRANAESACWEALRCKDLSALRVVSE